MFSVEYLTVEIYSDQNDGIYYFGEDVTIKTKSRNPLAILCATWHRESENEIYTIDTSLPKYTGKRDESNEYQLMIKNCDESDIGTYFLLLVCTDGLEMHSNRINLKILRGKFLCKYQYFYFRFKFEYFAFHSDKNSRLCNF